MIGINLLDLRKIKTGDFLPGLLLVVLVVLLDPWYGRSFRRRSSEPNSRQERNYRVFRERKPETAIEGEISRLRNDNQSLQADERPPTAI